jgi:hypothetical protein
MLAAPWGHRGCLERLEGGGDGRRGAWVPGQDGDDPARWQLLG